MEAEDIMAGLITAVVLVIVFGSALAILASPLLAALAVLKYLFS